MSSEMPRGVGGFGPLTSGKTSTLADRCQEYGALEIKIIRDQSNCIAGRHEEAATKKEKNRSKSIMVE